MSKVRLTGSNSGYVEIAAAADAGNLTFTMPTSGTALLGNNNNVFSGITTTGQLDINGSIDVSSTSVFNDDVTLTGGSYNVLWDKSDNQLEFGDNAKLSFGADADLQLFHDGNHSYVKDVGTGDLVLQTQGGHVMIKYGGDTMAFFQPSNKAELYFANSPKLATTNTGVVVNGICTATSFSGSGENLTRTTQLSHRNLIINGAMNVAQRGSSSTSSGYYTVDRFRNTASGTDEAPTQAQVDVAAGTTPYTLGFRKAYKMTNGNQTSGAGASDAIVIGTKLEAQDMASSGWNYTSASSFITLSFWVKSSVAQNFYGRLTTTDGTSQNYPFETGSLSANTWTKVTKTIPGNSNLQFDNNADKGIDIEWMMFRGTNNTDSGVTLNAWAAYASGTRTPDQTSTWYTTNDATFEITGVQLEVGEQATPFEHRSFGEELARCQRYFFALNNSGSVYYWFHPIDTSSVYRRCSIRFPTTMRAAPTASELTGNNAGSGGTPTGTQHADQDHIDIHWNSSGLVELTHGHFSAEL